MSGPRGELERSFVVGGGDRVLRPEPLRPLVRPAPSLQAVEIPGEIWDGGHVAALTPVWERAMVKQVGG